MSSHNLAEILNATAVLIGSSKFPRDHDLLPPLRGVVANVIDFERILLDPQFVGMDTELVHRILDEEIPHVVSERFAELAAGETDALLLYYAGHGIVSNSHKLLLAVPQSTFRHASSNALHWEQIQESIRNSAAKHKIVILDCCYSGLAMSPTMGTDVLRHRLETAGSVVITASPKNEPALAPAKARRTAFTDAFLSTIEAGIVNAGPTLSVREIFEECRRRMRLEGAPEPEIYEYGNASSVPLCRNVTDLRNVPSGLALQPFGGLRGMSATDIWSQEESLLSAAKQIQTLALPYGTSNRLRLTSLLEQLTTQSPQFAVRSPEELRDLLYLLHQRELLSGIVITPHEIYIAEHHLNWRSTQAVAEKQAVAAEAATWIQDGSRVFLDAGSSTLQICRIICDEFRFNQWSSLTLVTNSVPAAAQLSNLANNLGLIDSNKSLTVYVVGGRMRLNSSCIVRETKGPSPVTMIAERIGGFDIAFIGTNAVAWPEGCSTVSPLEAAGKRSALEHAKTRVVLAESSKYDIRLDEVFGTFDMGLNIVTASDSGLSRVEHIAAMLESTQSKVTIVGNR